MMTGGLIQEAELVILLDEDTDNDEWLRKWKHGCDLVIPFGVIKQVMTGTDGFGGCIYESFEDGHTWMGNYVPRDEE